MRKLRWLLFPFAGVYYVITLSRNKLYNLGILKSKKYPLPVICVGNLSTGGTGKSPMTEYLIRLLSIDFRVATLSRGYGRKTSGYLDVTPDSLATEVGDEPLQFTRKFDKIQVAVCEDRQAGIETLLAKKNLTNVIILDDAYQHRKVQAGFHILLTTYGDMYTNDYLLPAGNLREPRGGAHRADIVVVTKCPDTLGENDQAKIKAQLKLQSHQYLFFSKIVYDEQVYSEKGAATLNSLKAKKVTLVTGIANPKPFLNYLKRQGLSFEHKSYGDHHNFDSTEIAELDTLDCILTTEKDYVRLQPLLQMKQLYYLPIKIEFLTNETQINKKIKSFVRSF